MDFKGVALSTPIILHVQKFISFLETIHFLFRSEIKNS